MMIVQKPLLRCQSASGFTLLEMIIICGVLINLISLASKYMIQNAERITHQITAQQLQKVTQAAQYYVQDHWYPLMQAPNPVLLWRDLADNDYLPRSLPEQNHYGQHYQFTLQKEGDQLQLLLTTQGGQTIREGTLRKIAAMAGDQAGYITDRHPNKIVGNEESWFIETHDIIEPGHLASLTVINEKTMIDAASFLRRAEFPGHPEYNRMESDLQIADSKQIFFESKKGFSLSKNKLQAENGDNSVELTNSKINFYGKNGSYINITSGVNKNFSIHHPTGENMELWSNFLTLEHENTNSNIKISTQYKNNPTISVSGEGWGKIPYNHSIYGLSNYAEINPKFIKMPVYSYKPGEYYDGTEMVRKVCIVAG